MTNQGQNYSETPLYKKLGIKPGSRVAIVNAPDGFVEGFEIPAGVHMLERASEPLDVMLFFAEGRSHLKRRIEALVRYLDRDGGFWIAYAKKSSPLRSDLDFDFVQGQGLAIGLVDNKSCAIDQDWTAVRFVYRLADRRR